MNQKFQNVINKIPQKSPPIWFMRQAGRYHNHYQKLREKYSFELLCKKPELAAEVARGPVADFDFDVAILFSDILFPLEGLGMGLAYTEQGPKLSFQLDPSNLSKLNPAQQAIDFLKFQSEALQATRQVLSQDKSLIGFVGGLWTLYVYAVEGSHAGSLIKSKSNPKLFHDFLKVLFPVMKANIANQLASGAELVMIFDTAAGEVSPTFFQTEIEKYLIEIADQFPGKIGYYSKGTNSAHFSSSMVAAPWAGFGVDHRWNLQNAFQLKNTGFVQGNFDQALLFQDSDNFKKSLNHYLTKIKEYSQQDISRWVCGLGHGVLPKTPEAHVRYFVQQARQVFP